jgi:hypothetical protein
MYMAGHGYEAVIVDSLPVNRRHITIVINVTHDEVRRNMILGTISNGSKCSAERIEANPLPIDTNRLS